MKLSIVIPSYNRYQTTLRLVNSFKDVDLTDIELIVVNDGSKEKYGAFPKYVKYIKTPNGGGQVARMKGWLESKGEYVWFFDSDDQINVEKLPAILKLLKDKDVYVFGLDRQRKNLKTKDQPYKVKHNKPETMGYCSYYQDKIFKSSVIEKNMFDKSSQIFQDENFMLRFGAKTKSVHVDKTLGAVATYLYNFGSISKRETTLKLIMKLVNNVESLVPFIRNLPEGKFKTKARKQMTRMLTIARGWALKLNRKDRKVLNKAVRNLRKNNKDVFSFLINYSTAYKLIAFVDAVTLT